MLLEAGIVGSFATILILSAIAANVRNHRIHMICSYAAIGVFFATVLCGLIWVGVDVISSCNL